MSDKRGLSPMKAARVEHEVGDFNAFGDDGDENTDIFRSRPVRPLTPAVATCAGQHFFAVLSPCDVSGGALLLQIWRHASNVITAQQPQSQPQAGSLYNGAPDLVAHVLVPDTFGRDACFIGEGTDGVSVILCDSHGNAGAVSVTHFRNSGSNNNGGGGVPQVYLHAAPMCGGSGGLPVLLSRGAVITDFAAINGGIFLGTSGGAVSAVRVLDREPADKWIALTASVAPSVLNMGDESNDEDQHAGGVSARNAGSSSSSSWGSWFGSFFTAPTRSASSPSTAAATAKRAQHAPPVVRVFPTSAARNHSVSCRGNNNNNNNSPPGWFSVHSDGRVVLHGPFNWVWRIPAPPANAGGGGRAVVLAVGDCPESRTVSVLFAWNDSDYFLATLPLSDGAAADDAGDCVPLHFPRALSAADGDYARCSVFLVRCQGERRAVVVTPQFTAAFNVAVGPRTPHNEVTVLEAARYTVAAQLVSTGAAGAGSGSNNGAREAVEQQQLLLLAPPGVGGGVRALHATSVFSAFQRESDRALAAELARFDGANKRQAFLRASNSLAQASEINPWNWASSGGNSSNGPLVQSDLNLITFVTQSLLKRTTDHGLFLSRWSNEAAWGDVGEQVRAAVLENQMGLAVLSGARTVQNSCAMMRCISAAFEQQQHGSGSGSGSFDLFRATADIFAALLPRAARHPRCVTAPVFQQQGSGEATAASGSSRRVGDAELVFGHPRNGFSLLHCAATMLAEVVRNPAAPADDKLMWAAVVGSIWAQGASACASLLQQYDGAGSRNGTLWAQLDRGWLDAGMPELLAAMSDAVCFAIDRANSSSSNGGGGESGEAAAMRQQLMGGIVEAVGALLSQAIDLHSEGRGVAVGLFRRTLMRDPLIAAAQYGYPFGFPQPNGAPAAAAASRTALLVAERPAVKENIFEVMWDFVSATNFGASASFASGNNQHDSVNVNGQQTYRAYCERVPGFFAFSLDMLLNEFREAEIAALHGVVPRVDGRDSREVRDAFLAQHSPSTLWAITAVGPESNAVEAVLASGYETEPLAPLASSALGHRAVCTALAKLAWAAEGRPARTGRATDVEAKVALAQRTFLPASPAPLAHADLIRALLQQPVTAENGGDAAVAACDLADSLDRASPVKALLLREILRKLFDYEGAALVQVANDQALGEQVRLRRLNGSLTARTLAKSTELLTWCNVPEDTHGIAAATSREFAQMLFQWRHLTMHTQ